MGTLHESCATIGSAGASSRFGGDRLPGVDPTTAWQWLLLPEHDEVMRTANRGRQAIGKASRYRYPTE